MNKPPESPSNFIRFRRFSTQTEAQLAQALLDSHGITATVVGAKDYSAHLLGGTGGIYHLAVDESHIEKTEEIFEALDAETTTGESGAEGRHFRRAVFFACAAIIILPIAFNIASLYQGKKFWERSDRGTKAVGKMIVILLLQIPAAIVVVYSYRMISDGISLLAP